MLTELFIEKFKNVVNDKISNARLMLMSQDGFLPLVLSSTLSGVVEAEIDLEETPKDEASSLLRQYATSPDVEGLALIFMASTVLLEDDTRELPEDISNEPDAMEAIMVYVYTKEKSEYRRIPFKKLENGNYWFADEGWKVPTSLTGRFANPFQG